MAAQTKRAVEVVMNGKLSSSYKAMLTKSQAGLRKNRMILEGIAGQQKRMNSGGGGMLGMAAGAAAAYVSIGQVVGLVKSSIADYNASERAQTRLATLMGNVKGTTKAQIQNIRDYSAVLQKRTTLEDDAAIAGASQLASFQLQGKTVRKLMPAMADLAAYQYGVDASQENLIKTGTLLGKAMTGNAGALSKAGVTLSKTQTKIIKTGTEAQRAAVLIEVMNKNAGGLAVALGIKPEGKIAMIAHAWGDVKEELGGRLMPVQMKVIGWVSSHLPDIQKAIMKIVAEVGRLGREARPTLKMLGEKALWIRDNWDKIKPVVKALAGAYVALRTTIVLLTLAENALTVAKTIGRIASLAKAGATRIEMVAMAAYRAEALVMIGVQGLWTVASAAWTSGAIASTAAMVAMKIAAGAQAVATGVATAAQWAWNVALTANPIGLIIVGVAALAYGVYKLVTNWKAVVGWLEKAWNWMKKIGGSAIAKVAGWFGGGGGKSAAAKVGAHAAGGIVSRPQVSWIGERGPEAIIPLTNRRRGMDLWRQTGTALGVAGAGVGGGGGITVNFSPQITVGPGGDINTALAASERRIFQKLREDEHNRKRRSYGSW